MSSSPSSLRQHALLCLVAIQIGWKAVQGATNPLVIKGYKFFDSVTGENVPIKGVDYYPRPNHGDLDENNLDLFANRYEHIWKRDIPYFKDLGINALRLYAVDPDEKHDKFMNALSSAGIYVVVGLAANCKNCEITQEDAPDCYPKLLKQRGQRIIQNFAEYPNVMAFSAGNEVNSGIGSQERIVCQKKFLRDMRAYIGQCPSLRKIPVGAVLADIGREENSLYFNCQSDPKDEFEHAEWYGLNSYVLCAGNATSVKDAPGFLDLLTSFQSYKYSIPVLLTEYGCLNPSFPNISGYDAQRTFHQAKWLYSEEFRKSFAGGFVFEYSTELTNAGHYPFKEYGAQNFGLGYFMPENCDDKKIKCTYKPMPNYDNLKRAYESVQGSKNDVALDEFTPEKNRTGRTTCPKMSQFKDISSFKWEADSLDDLPCSKVSGPRAPWFHAHEIAILCGIATLIAILLIALIKPRRLSGRLLGNYRTVNEGSPLLNRELISKGEIEYI